MPIVVTDVSTGMENNFNVTILKLQDSFGQKFDSLDAKYGEIKGMYLKYCQVGYVI